MDVEVSRNELPENFHAVIRRVNDEFPDIREAKQEAVRQARKLKNFREFADALADRAIARCVELDRCHHTAILRRRAIAPPPQKLDYNRSDRVNSIYAGLYGMAVAGTRLGALTGEQLPSAAETERKLGQGHLANAALLDSLAPLVPSNKSVQQCVSLKRLKALVKKTHAAVNGVSA